MPGRKTTVLAVDDDVRVLRMMHRILEVEGYHVADASDGRTALDAIDEEDPDLILLDIMLPDTDGYTLCHRIREFSKAPVVMVTARGNDGEKILGFDAGADDYVTKPFSSLELVARVRAVLRRTALREERGSATFQFDDLTVDFARRRVTVAGQEADLTATEYRVLCYLAGNAGRVVTPDQILEHVWGEAYTGETHLLQVYIARLRRKIGDETKDPRYILTRPGIGYMMRKCD